MKYFLKWILFLAIAAALCGGMALAEGDVVIPLPECTLPETLQAGEPLEVHDISYLIYSGDTSLPFAINSEGFNWELERLSADSGS